MCCRWPPLKMHTTGSGPGRLVGELFLQHPDLQGGVTQWV
jgi:hypothetical protein